MCFQLVYGDFQHPLPLPFEEHIQDRLLKIVSHDGISEQPDLNRRELARRIADLVSAIVEGEFVAPTDRQLKYAAAIAEEFSLEIPSRALQYRVAMTAFLNTHAERYRVRKGIPGGRGALSS